MGDLIAFPLTRRARIRVLRAALLDSLARRLGADAAMAACRRAVPDCSEADLSSALLEAEGLTRARAAAMRAEVAAQQVVCPARVARLRDALRAARAARLSEAGLTALCKAAEPECSLSEIVEAMRAEVAALRAQLASREQRRDKRGARRSRTKPSP